MWHIFNLIRVDDTIRASTLRKVAQESATGSKLNSRIKLTLTIVVETIDFDSTVCSLHLKGTIYKINYNFLKFLWLNRFLFFEGKKI